MLTVGNFLAGDAQLDAGNGLAARVGDGRIALPAKLRAFASRQPAAGTLDGILDTGVNLILYGTVTGPTTGHADLLWKEPLSYLNPETSREG